jgi:hypothetical protein
MIRILICELKKYVHEIKFFMHTKNLDLLLRMFFESIYIKLACDRGLSKMEFHVDSHVIAKMLKSSEDEYVIGLRLIQNIFKKL